MVFLLFCKKDVVVDNSVFVDFLKGYLIEVMLCIVEKIDDFCDFLFVGICVYIVYIEGILIEDMVVIVVCLWDEGFDLMLYFFVCIIKDVVIFEEWVNWY